MCGGRLNICHVNKDKEVIASDIFSARKTLEIRRGTTLWNGDSKYRRRRMFSNASLQNREILFTFKIIIRELDFFHLESNTDH